MKFCLEPDAREIDFSPEVVILAGHTGREPSLVEEHIRELEAQGVRPPASVPEYTIVPAALLMQSSVVQTPSSRTSALSTRRRRLIREREREGIAVAGLA